jgi:uroporphyrin-III C-methyltransferase
VDTLIGQTLNKIIKHINSNTFERPTLVIDIKQVEEKGFLAPAIAVIGAVVKLHDILSGFIKEKK